MMKHKGYCKWAVSRYGVSWGSESAQTTSEMNALLRQMEQTEFASLMAVQLGVHFHYLN